MAAGGGGVLSHERELTLVCLYSLMAERSSSDTSSCISTNALWLPESF